MELTPEDVAILLAHVRRSPVPNSMLGMIDGDKRDVDVLKRIWSVRITPVANACFGLSNEEFSRMLEEKHVAKRRHAARCGVS